MWLLLKEDLSKSFDSQFCFLLPMNKINFIIGKNNGGKSYLMRYIINNCLHIYNERNELLVDIRDGISKIQISNFKEPPFKNVVCNQIFEKYSLHLEKISNVLNEAKSTSVTVGIGYGSNRGYKRYNYDFPEDINTILEECGLGDDNVRVSEYFDAKLKTGEINYKEDINEIFKRDIITQLYNLDDKELYLFSEFIETKNIEKNIDLNYIPIFRSLRHPTKCNETKENPENIYKNRIIKEYKYSEEHLNIITGLDFYQKYKEALLGAKTMRDNCTSFEKFLSVNFFEGKEVSIVPDEQTFEVKINIDNEEDRFIYEVGDGIASLVIILYELYVNPNKKENSIYFIEEPENSFHAAYQRMLINTILFDQRFNNTYFYFTTHSNDLIDIGINENQCSSLLLCKKSKEGINVELVKNDKVQILNELGVKTTSVGVANKVIWVEGKYDAFLIRLLLNLYFKEYPEFKKFIEDYDYSFLPYGGSNIALVNFIDESNDLVECITNANKINPNFMIILDKDDMDKDKTSKKYKRYDKLKKSLKSKVYRLDVREIENLFNEEVLIKFINDNIKEEYKITIDLIDFKNYKDYSLGDYINDILNQVYKQNKFKKITGRENGFKESSNSSALYDKQKFYNSVVSFAKEENFDYETKITEEAKCLVNTILKFLNE